MKNVSKLFLLGILAGAGYFFGVVVYGACSTVPGIGTICGNTDVCNNVGGCLCNGLTIAQGVTCSTVIVPSTDGILGTTSFGQTCSDGDGCSCISPSGTTTVTDGQTCTWDITLPMLSAGTVTINNRTATFGFTSTKAGTVSYNGSCGNGSLSTAVVGNNTTNFNLNNATYSNCQLKITDSLNNVSPWLSIPSFTINYTGGTVIGGGGGGGSTSMCSDIYLTCTNGIYTLKTGYYCAGGSLGKTCNVSLGTGVDQTLEIIREEKSVVYEYTPQGVKIRIYVPKYRIYLIKKTILKLNKTLINAINKKLLKVTDPSYMIENYENLDVDSKIIVYKEIGAITKLYNDFLGILYLVLDMKQKEYLPLAKTYLETYFKEFAKFQK